MKKGVNHSFFNELQCKTGVLLWKLFSKKLATDGGQSMREYSQVLREYSQYPASRSCATAMHSPSRAISTQQGQSWCQILIDRVFQKYCCTSCTIFRLISKIQSPGVKLVANLGLRGFACLLLLLLFIIII